jgi:hypothetical protein
MDAPTRGESQPVKSAQVGNQPVKPETDIHSLPQELLAKILSENMEMPTALTNKAFRAATIELSKKEFFELKDQVTELLKTIKTKLIETDETGNQEKIKTLKNTLENIESIKLKENIPIHELNIAISRIKDSGINNLCEDLIKLKSSGLITEKDLETLPEKFILQMNWIDIKNDKSISRYDKLYDYVNAIAEKNESISNISFLTEVVTIASHDPREKEKNEGLSKILNAIIPEGQGAKIKEESKVLVDFAKSFTKQAIEGTLDKNTALTCLNHIILALTLQNGQLSLKREINSLRQSLKNTQVNSNSP